MSLDTFDATLTAAYALTPRVRHYLLRVEDHAFAFRPGQHTSIVREVDGRPVARTYTPVAGPHEGGATDTLALAIKRYEGGTVSAWMADKAPGATIQVTDLEGRLTLRDPTRDALFLATGTGLTPMLAMLGQHLAHDAHDAGARTRATLVFGERTAGDLMYRAALDRLTTQHPDRLRVLYTLSDASDGWTGRTGYVQAHLADALDGLDAPHAYVCGVPEMVVATRDALTDAHGLAEDAVFTEGWEEGAV
jgi:ferredoxin-NADP reductase